MPFDGNGTYALPSPAYPAISGASISSADYNNVLADLATALTTCLTKNGQTTATGHIPLGNFRITGLGNAVASTDALNKSQLTASEAALAASGGSALAGHIGAGTGAVATTVQQVLRETVSAFRFMTAAQIADVQAKTNLLDVTAAVQAAINAVFAAGGGTLWYPPGSYSVTGLSLNWGTSGTSVIFRGAGKQATIIRKRGVTTSAVIDLQATLTDGSYSEVSDMWILGISTCDGFRTEGIARCVWRNVKVSGCDAGIENESSLINSYYDCDLMTNVVGYRARKTATGAYCNLVEMFGGSIRGNSSWGIDAGATSGLHLYGTDIEGNGTAGVVGSGGLITRSTCDDEIGYSIMSLNGVWFESNKGTSISAEACVGLRLTLGDTLLLGSEAGRAITVGAIGLLALENVVAGSPGDTITVAAATFTAKQCVLNVLADTSTTSVYENVVTGTATYQSFTKSGTGTFTIGGDATKSKNGVATTTTAVASTIFAASGTRGMYEVYACLDGGGATYISTARIGFDGTNAVRMGGENGANLTITVSGLNVQVTQISGANQFVYYVYLKVGE